MYYKKALVLLAVSFPTSADLKLGYINDRTDYLDRSVGASGAAIEYTRGKWFLSADYVSQALFLRTGRELYRKSKAYVKFGVCYTAIQPTVVDSLLMFNTVFGMDINKSMSVEFSHCSNAGYSEVNRGYNGLLFSYTLGGRTDD